MKNRNTVFTALVTLAFALPLATVSAQTSEPAAAPSYSIKATAELVSHYVWRGSMATGSPTPNIQPTLAYVKGNFEIGVWGSTDFIGSYKEVDPYASLTCKQIKFTLTDYNWNFGRAKYFEYSNSKTGHMLEGTVGYTGPESFPISVSLNTMFYGFDKKGPSAGVDSAKQAYSTYVELGYTKGPAAFFLGFTPWAGYYNNYGVTNFDPTASKKAFSIVNVGVTLSRSVKITNDFSLPLRATLVINPSATYSQADYIHLVFGITF
jgi:hypothetical protein